MQKPVTIPANAAVNVIRTITYDIPAKGIIQVNELADGTYHGCGTTHIYTREQFESARAKMLALGATEKSN